MGSSRLARVANLPRLLAVLPLRLYRRFISPLLPRRCKYEPTCSAYALNALRTYGAFRGTVLAVWRVLRCNPFSHGGYDPVHAQTIFRSREDEPARQPASIAPRTGR